MLYKVAAIFYTLCLICDKTRIGDAETRNLQASVRLCRKKGSGGDYLKTTDGRHSPQSSAGGDGELPLEQSNLTYS